MRRAFVVYLCYLCNMQGRGYSLHTEGGSALDKDHEQVSDGRPV